jgi:hypothetical protein
LRAIDPRRRPIRRPEDPLRLVLGCVVSLTVFLGHRAKAALSGVDDIAGNPRTCS